MEKIPKVRFTEEFKEEAAKMVVEGGLSVSKVATRLSMPTSTFAYWVKLAYSYRRRLALSCYP